MLDLTPLTPRNYHKNLERAGDLLPCVVCGRGIRNNNPPMVHVHNGGHDVVTEEEASKLRENADMGWFPIGPECLKKHPELNPYLRHTGGAS